jgi:hypothetical protein
VINQVQGALLLHNIPLFCFLIVFSFLFLYSFKWAADSGFPVFLYAASVYPVANLLLKLGGFAVLESLAVKLPELSRNCPDRIRTIEEIVEMSWKPVLAAWRFAFFVYRLYLCPNDVDILLFLAVVIAVGLLYCILPIVTILCIVHLMVLTFPAILSRRGVYEFLMRHLGHLIADADEPESE